jgi:hypothetical protein
MSETYLNLIQHSFWFKFPLIVCSFLFLYTGLFLHETEQGLIQNRLEEWWCKLDDAASSALNRNLRVLQGTAIRFQAHLESRFGRKFFSFQSIGVSICWGMISAKFTVVILGLISGNPPFKIIGGQLLGILFFWYLSKGPRILPSNRHHVWFVAVVLIWISLIITAYTSGTLGNIINGPPPVPSASNQRIVRLGLAVVPLYTLGVLVSTAFTLVFVLISRHSLRYITESRSKTRLIKATFLHSLFLLLAIWLHLVFIAKFKTQTDFRDYIFLITTPIMGYAYWMTLGLSFMIIHMLFWAVMQRPLYALQRIGGERRNRLFVVVGLVLLGLAFPSVGEILKSSLSALKSLLT